MIKENAQKSVTSHFGLGVGWETRPKLRIRTGVDYQRANSLDTLVWHAELNCLTHLHLLLTRTLHREGAKLDNEGKRLCHFIDEVIGFIPELTTKPSHQVSHQLRYQHFYIHS